MSTNDPQDPTRQTDTRKSPPGVPSTASDPDQGNLGSSAGSRQTGSRQTGSRQTGTSSGTSSGAPKTSPANRPGTTGTSGTTATTGAAGTAANAGTTPGVAGARPSSENSAGASAPSASGQGASSNHGSSSDPKEKIRDQVRETSEKLKTEAREAKDRLTESARAHLDSGASYDAGMPGQTSQSMSGGSAMGRLGRYARNQPVMVVGGALIAGFLIARALRASSRRQEQANNPMPAFAHDQYDSSSIPTGFN